MQLIVHCGTFKTGTTSIQQLFFRNRAAFLEQGVLYPETSTKAAHHALFALFQDSVPDAVLRRLGLDSAGLVDRARQEWDAVKREIARTRPDKVVLSSELFLLSPSLEGFQRFRALLDEAGPQDITPCAYVRAPALHYLSRVQENAKFSGDVTPPQPLTVRGAVQAVEAAFGGPMALRAYDQEALLDGDVVTDFVREIVGATLPDGVGRGHRYNTSLSAEAMSISVASRRANHAGKDQQPVGGHWRLLARIAELERSLGRAAKPRLKAHVAEAVTCASDDLLWLRDAKGIVFGGIDYGAINGRMSEAIAGYCEIDQICDVDAAQRDMLLLRLVNEGLEAQRELARLKRAGPLGRIRKTPSLLRDAGARLVRATRVKS